MDEWEFVVVEEVARLRCFGGVVMVGGPELRVMVRGHFRGAGGRFSFVAESSSINLERDHQCDIINKLASLTRIRPRFQFSILSC